MTFQQNSYTDSIESRPRVSNNHIKEFLAQEDSLQMPPMPVLSNQKQQELNARKMLQMRAKYGVQ